MTAAEQTSPPAEWLQLDGAVNVRDVGGLPTVDGRTTRSGVLLRADNLQDLTDEDVRQLVDERGLRTVIDLRSRGEVHLEGSTPLQGTAVRHHHLSLIAEFPGDSDQEEVERVITSGYEDPDPEVADPGGPTPGGRRRDSAASRAGARRNDMSGYYVGYVEDAPQNIAEALKVIADGEGGPALVHCAAGKDRTGIVVALALSLVGVTRAAVVADYLRSAERIDAILARLKGSTTYAEELATTTTDQARPDVQSIERFLDHVDSAYGGVHGLAMSLGVDESTIAKLGARLVGTSPVAR